MDVTLILDNLSGIVPAAFITSNNVGVPVTYIPAEPVPSVNPPVPPIATLTGDGETVYNFSAETSTGFFAVQDANGAIVIYANDEGTFVAGANAFCKVWSCADATHSAIGGNLTLLEANSGWYGDLALTALDVSSCTALTRLDCAANPLMTLNVSGCTMLNYLNCSSNSLTTLNVSGLTALVSLYCGSGSLATVYIARCPALTHLDCSYNKLTQSAVDSVLSILNTNGLTGGNCQLNGTGNSAPSASGLISKAALVAKSWTVATN